MLLADATCPPLSGGWTTAPRPVDFDGPSVSARLGGHEKGPQEDPSGGVPANRRAGLFVDHANWATGPPVSRFDKFVAILSNLSAETWNAAITEEPEWKYLQPRSGDWEFGRFAALFVLLGLNDYQTKRTADVGYWPKVVRDIPRTPSPKTPATLAELLEPFFSHERFGSNKVTRLRRFTCSPPCADIWVADAPTLAATFPAIWERLGLTMKQPATAKTIAFAMKCLALALLMVGEDTFDFSSVPVPVDLRIKRVSERLGLQLANEEAERNTWQAALKAIQARRPEVTMVHLDSILWQIGSKTKYEITMHLVALGASGLATDIANLFDSIA